MNASTSAATSKPYTMHEKNKSWRMESLMENLRAKSSNARSFQELSKFMRMSLLEKRYALDAVEKVNLQKTLDSMQHCIRVTTRQGLVERLESVTRQLGLKFTDNASSIFISSDMFYLEILLDPSGAPIDVKVHHECNIKQESDSELVSVLKAGDFNDFTQQLEGFQSIYQLNAESKIKSKAFVCLQALETDLINIFILENLQKIPTEKLLLTSSVGILQKRRGGHPMRLIFFVRPNELLNFEKGKFEIMTPEYLAAATQAKKEFGDSFTVNLEAAAPANKLQLQPIFNISKNEQGRSSPCFNQITSQNSTILPATFVLRLNKPMPLSSKIEELINQISDLTLVGNNGQPINTITNVKIEGSNSEVSTVSTNTSLINLIIQHESENNMQSSKKGLFVSLADQVHCYFFSDNKDLKGTMIKSIRFTEPQQVTKVVKLLRQQTIFNALVGSCIRLNGKHDLENMYMFELSLVSMQTIQIFVEHPFNEAIVTVELNLTDVTQLQVRIYYGDQRVVENDFQMENYAMQVLQKTISIPLMLRSLIKFWEKDCQMFNNSTRNFSNIDQAKKDDDSSQEELDHNMDLSNLGKKDDRKDDDNGFGGSNSNGNSSNSDSKPNGSNYGGGSKDNENSSNNDQSNGSKSQGGNSDSSGFDNGAGFDICGVNKNEIFFKSTTPSYNDELKNNQPKQTSSLKRGHSQDFDIFDQKSKARPKSYDFEDDIEMNENFLNEDNSLTSSSSDSSSSSSESITKNDIFNSKASSASPKTKPMDVFEFTPSPPTSAPVTGTSSMHLNNIEIIPLNPVIAPIPGNPINQQKPRTSPPSKNFQGPSLSTTSNPSSITITPINAAYFGTKDKEKEKKIEKKKKRKREDDLMGPPVRKKVSSPKKRASSKSPVQKPLLSPLSPGMMNFSMNSPQNPNLGGLQGSSNQAIQGFNLKNDDDAFFDLSIFQGMSQEDKLMMLSLNQQGSQSTTIPSPLPSPGCLNNLNNLNNLNLNLKNRKGSLSAVIDKLKSAQTGDELDLIEEPKDKTSSEYQVKSTGRDGTGIKITINKTKPSGNSSTGSSKSSKSASGLKPGVNSGPASKKSSSSSSLSPKNPSQKFLYQKSNSSGSLPLKSSSSSVSPKLQSKSQHSSPLSLKSNSSKDLSKVILKDSQSQMEVLKMMGISPHSQAIDGFLKGFDSSKKFQIPKLSARPSQSQPAQPAQGVPPILQKKEEKEDFIQHNQQKYNSAPSTPIQSLTPSPTAEIGKSIGDPYVNKYMSSGSNKFGLFPEHNPQMQHNSLQHAANSQKTKKLFKSISSEQLYEKDTKDVLGGITRQVTTPSPTFNPNFNHDSLMDLPIFHTNSNILNSNKPKENIEGMRSQLQVHMIQKQNFHDDSNSLSGLGNLGSMKSMSEQSAGNLGSLGKLATSPGLLEFSDDMLNDAFNAGEI